MPLTNTDANQVRVNVKYTIEDDTLKNKKLNAVMKVTAPNGTLIRTTSIPNGFTAKSGGGIEGLKTTFHDKLMDKISANITLTDITKKTPLSNALTLTLNLKEPQLQQLQVHCQRINPFHKITISLKTQFLTYLNTISLYNF